MTYATVHNPSSFWVTLFGSLLFAALAEAGDWDITPRISLAEIYSDNINLDDSDKESELVTEVSPGISVHGESARLKADLDYQLQGAFFLRNTDASNLSQQLSAKATAEVTRNFFYVDASSRMGQAIVDANSTISTDNVNNAGNQTNYYAYGVSPYITPHFGGYADGVFRYSLDHVRYDDDASNSLENRFDATLVSGRKFGPLSWFANYLFDDVNRNKASNARYQNANGEVRYAVNRKFSLVAQAGWEDNDIQSSDQVENGTYWAAGGFWQPSRYYSLQALTGDNLTTATVGIYPGRRTALVVTYTDKGVGLNTGETWSGTFQHRTRRTNWSANYSEDTTTQQQQQLGEGGLTFIGVDPDTGETNPNPQPGDLVVIAPTGPIVSLTNEVEERKRASGSVGMKTGKTGLIFRVFRTQRRFLTSLREEDVTGFSGSVNRRVAPRTNALLSGTWQRTKTDDPDNDRNNGSRDFWYIGTDLMRQIWPRLDGMVGYRFTRQEPGKGSGGYDENRVTARITAYF